MIVGAAGEVDVGDGVGMNVGEVLVGVGIGVGVGSTACVQPARMLPAIATAISERHIALPPLPKA